MRRHPSVIVSILLLTAFLLLPLRSVDARSLASSTAAQEEAQEEEAQDRQERQRIEEIVVVSASGGEQLMLEAPTAISVIDSADIALSPAQNYADLLRGTPGVNVTQTSARDINVSSRSAVSTLDASQLVLIDGRSVYQDFFGFVAWDLLPLDFSEIEQIEVIRGPASAVWGANAMSGVVNIITKDPRSMGNSFRVRAGGGERSTGFGSVTYSGVSDNVAYRLTGSYQRQDPWERPGPLPSGTPRDIFANEGTKQPKGDARIDIGRGESWWSVMGGIAGTGGTIHTGIGPFSIKDGTSFWYLRGDYNWRDLNVKAYANVLDGDAINLLNGLPFLFESTTYHLAATNSSTLGDHQLTYGATFRTINFDLSIAPGEDNRSEGGGFVSADLNLTDYLSVDAGVRADKFSILDDMVFSPRGAVLFRPTGTSDHVLRASFGRAFRAPSMINNFLDVTIFNAVALPGVGQFVFPSAVFGNPELSEERHDQLEIGYRGWLDRGRISWDIAAYRTVTKDSIDFFTKGVYTAANPPPGWPLPTFLLPPFGPVLLPSEFSYRNVGEFINRGIEIGIRVQPMARNSITANYSWQDEPEVTGVPADEIGIPPAHRLYLGWNGYHQNLFYGLGVNHQSEAYWTDVLDSRFFGFTDSFTTVDVSLGHMFSDGKYEASIRATNLLDEDMQQHVFGDIIGRRILGEVAVNIY